MMREKELVSGLLLLLTISMQATTNQLASIVGDGLPQHHSTKLVDSIIAEARQLPTFIERTKLLRRDYLHTVPHTLVLLDTARVWHIQELKPQEWGKSYFYHIEYYRAQANRAGLLQLITELKELVATYPSATNEEYYFQALTVLIQMKVVEGDTEHARYDIANMLKEAERLHSDNGRFFAYYLKLLLLHRVDKSEAVNDTLQHYLQLATEIPNKPVLQERWLASRYYVYYLKVGDKERALEALQRENEMVYQTLEEREKEENPDRGKGSIYATLVRNYVRMAKLVPKEAWEQRKGFLLKAQVHYPQSTFLGYNLNYLQEWAKYYYDKQEWEACLGYCNQALELGKLRRWQYKVHTARMRAESLEKLGRLSEAVEMYQYMAQQKDSLNQTLLANHHEAIEKNFQVKELLRKKMKNQNRNYVLLLLSLVILGAILCYVALTIIQSEKQIRGKRGEIKRLYLAMERENSEKLSFLKRIVKQVNPRLQRMMQCAKELGEQLGSEQQQRFAAQIREEAQAILNLVMGVLDLSRLEVKRVNYHYQTNCLATQLRGVVAAVNQEARPNYTLMLQEEEKLNSLLMPLLISLDWGSMEKVLHALLRPTYGLTAPVDTVVSLHRKEDTGVALVVTNPVLYQLPQEEQIIASRINELLISQMGGGYTQELVEQEWVVTLTFNKVEARHFNPGISAAAASST